MVEKIRRRSARKREVRGMPQIKMLGDLITEAGLSQRFIADAAGTSQASLSRTLSGDQAADLFDVEAWFNVLGHSLRPVRVGDPKQPLRRKPSPKPKATRKPRSVHVATDDDRWLLQWLGESGARGTPYSADQILNRVRCHNYEVVKIRRRIVKTLSDAPYSWHPKKISKVWGIDKSAIFNHLAQIKKTPP